MKQRKLSMSGRAVLRINRIHRIQRQYLRPPGEIRLGSALSVEALAFNPHVRALVARYAYSDQWYQPGKRPVVIVQGRGPRRHRMGTAYHRPPKRVKATIQIDAYLTRDVPARLSTKTCTISSEGEALVKAADMYAKIYREDQRLGGGPAFPTAAALRVRMTRRRRRAKQKGYKGPILRNRGFGPYIWGHDLGDLVFERMYVKWLSRSRCEITFSIGS